MRTILVLLGASILMDPPVTRNITGTMLKVMRESFHCTARATMNAEKNIERA